MNRQLFIPDLASDIEVALDYELKLAGIYAKIARELTDPTLQSLIYSLSGDSYGHSRTLAIIQALTKSLAEQHISPTTIHPYPTLHLSHPPLKKSSFRVKPVNTEGSSKGGDSNRNELSSM